MKFQVRTVYALRVLGYFYKNNNSLSKAVDISNRLNIPYMFLMKTIGIMKDAGFIRSIQGCNGGYMMALHSDEINVYEVVKALEGDFSLFQQMGEKIQEGEIEIKRFFDEIQEQMVGVLKDMTIKKLYESKSVEQKAI